MLAELRQDFAGVGGDVRFVRTAGDVYSYHEIVSDLVGSLHLQGGHITGWGCNRNTSASLLDQPPECLRMLDHFQMGPEPCARLRTRRHRAARSLALWPHRHRRRARGVALLGRQLRSADAALFPARRIRGSKSPLMPTPARCGTTSVRPAGRQPVRRSRAPFAPRLHVRWTTPCISAARSVLA